MILGGQKKLFWSTITLFGLRNPTFGGVIYFFSSKSQFWRFPGLILIIPEISYFAICSSEMLRSKSFRSMTPPKGGFWGKFRFLGLKKFLGAPQNQKNWFSQKTQILWFVWTWMVVKGVAPKISFEFWWFQNWKCENCVQTFNFDSKAW